MATSDDLKKFGNRLKDLRSSRGWTQDELGERAGLNSKYAGEMERGERNPSLDVILRLARALDVDPAELVGDDLSDLNREDLLERVVRELSQQSNPELRAWLRVSRARVR
jgi:transcriptional regulator with XRE-family HTH domain